MPTIFQMFSNSNICFAPRFLGLLQGVDGPLGKCGACAHERQLTREELTTLSIPVEVEGHPLKSVQDALGHFFRWEDVDFGIDCPDCPVQALSSQRRHLLESYPKVLCLVLVKI